MAPQENEHQEHAPLIQPTEEMNSPSDQSSLLSDPLDVVIVQYEGNIPPLSSGEVAADGKPGKGGLKGAKKKGAEVPVNCPHLETALFYFGIAGMVVSVVMLLQHIIGNLISYY